MSRLSAAMRANLCIDAGRSLQPNLLQRVLQTTRVAPWEHRAAASDEIAKERQTWHCFSAVRRASGGTSSSCTVAAIVSRQERRQSDLEAAAGGIEVTEQAKPVLFSVAAKDWLALKEPMVATKTYAMYSADVDRLKPHFGALLVTDITDRDVADYITARRQKKIAEKSIRNELGTLRGILRKHKRWEGIKENVRVPKGREDVAQAWSEDEEERLFKAWPASTSRSLLVVVTLALNTGMRHDEMRLLRWRQ